ncbi:oxidoreductase [Dyella caseinilytica]|uniref:Oxidoreductase n=1 Tax=Dyella caseinilytica TaxID=1849581 RepID=A0ABX7GPS2_9GAMM|nr:oxidoreductase [Dyella caseinilytica]QRN52429.1 oxidoreductase [Dyella caseinilytica]GGA05918.1 hypothetical protein GCM10011408_28570 [Dyella caseinilytica]
MAPLPQRPRSLTVEAIYKWWADQPQRLSRRLGASQIGNDCERRLFYSFRWAAVEQFEGRMLRLFNRGHREEQVFTDELRGIGCTVHDLDPATGEQFTFTGCGGHLVAKIDGVAVGIPEAPKTWHNVSYKTSGEKSFAKLAGKSDDRKKYRANPSVMMIPGDGVAVAKPEHVDQNQVEMHLSNLTRTLYLAVCKDDDSLHAERIDYSPAEGTRLVAKAERVIFAEAPPEGISSDPSFYKCKICPMTSVCHTAQLPRVSCRTCLHSTPEREGDGRWSCAKWGQDIPHEHQADGCPAHRYIPVFLKRWGEVVDASEAENWVEYKTPDGHLFRNGERGPNSYESSELFAATPEFIRDPAANEVRDTFDARIVQKAA